MYNGRFYTIFKISKIFTGMYLNEYISDDLTGDVYNIGALIIRQLLQLKCNFTNY